MPTQKKRSARPSTFSVTALVSAATGMASGSKRGAPMSTVTRRARPPSVSTSSASTPAPVSTVIGNFWQMPPS